MNELLDYLNEVSVFGRSAVALFLILGISFAFSLLHTLQEWRGSGGPLWRNFGAIVGLQIPDKLGFLGFTLGLTVALWTAGLMGYAGYLPIRGSVEMQYAIGALGLLLGARVSDTLVSHILLHFLRYRPNPGLTSTILYVVEAIFIIVAFNKGLSSDITSAGWGIAGGVLFFCLVLPLLWLLRFLFPGWRQDRWIRGEPLPPWTKD